tara:strand:+ start:22781 stop:25153 length:2373 start_codon:yes stop_codon:yes gene_type:complete
MHDTLLHALATVDRPGDFSMAGDLPLTLPGLVVEGVGLLRLPLGKTQARKLIARCRQAPYGKGTQTLVDTTVRRVWELDARHLVFTNPKWGPLIDSVVEDLQRQLGLEDLKLTAHLYKLLVYEKGSFFLPHRDGEKLDGMVATLVVVLPSEHEGGALIVSHSEQQREFRFAGAASGHELSYAAFYADCEHEVRPIESGYRLCLTYNVVLGKSRGRKGRKGLNAPSYGEIVDRIAALLGEWRRHPDREKLAITLDHRYTQAGLTLGQLKGIDRSRAEVLFAAAERAGCMAHLALVTLWRLGTAESDYEDYSSGWNNRYYWKDDDWEDGEDQEESDSEQGSSGYEMGEVLDYSLSADHWSDPHGRKVHFGAIALDESEIVAAAALDAGSPSEEEFEGYTGNAGMTLERWYHRAAVVMWPPEEHFAVLCAAGTDAALAGFEAMVKRLRRAGESVREAQRQECLGFATAIIGTWKPAYAGASWCRQEGGDRDSFSRLLCELDDPAVLGCFLTQVLTVDPAPQLDKSFVAFSRRHGWSRFEKELRSVITSSRPESLVRNAQLVRLLCRQRDRSAERLALCVRLCQDLAGTVMALDRKPAARPGLSPEVDRSALLVASVDAMLAVDAQSPLSSLLNHALNSPDKYELTGSHLAAIFALQPRLGNLSAPNQAISRWLETCREVLQLRTAAAPVKPQDYRRARELSCNCGDCRQLSRFLADAEQKELRLPLKKDRRQHLHQIIDRNLCDLTHVTERRGRPFTLVCTKTLASWQKACEVHARDLSHLARVEVIARRLPT